MTSASKTSGYTSGDMPLKNFCVCPCCKGRPPLPPENGQPWRWHHEVEGLIPILTRAQRRSMVRRREVTPAGLPGFAAEAAVNRTKRQPSKPGTREYVYKLVKEQNLAGKALYTAVIAAGFGGSPGAIATMASHCRTGRPL